jgi:hypothetical protein
VARLSAGVRGWMPLAIYESTFLSPENGPPRVGETVGSRRQWWTFHSRHRGGGLQVRGINSHGGGLRTVAASEASEYVAADFHGNRLIRKDWSWLGAVEVRVNPEGLAPSDKRIVDALISYKGLSRGDRRAACQAVAKKFGIAAVQVDKLYGSMPEDLRRPGRSRHGDPEGHGENIQDNGL